MFNNDFDYYNNLSDQDLDALIAQEKAVLNTQNTMPQGVLPQDATSQGGSPTEDAYTEYLYRPAARAAKSVAQGIGNTADFVNIPVNAGLEYFGKQPLPSATDNIGQYFDQKTGGLTVPRNNLEKVVDSASQFVAGGIPFAGAAKAAQLTQSPRVAEALSTMAPQNISELLGFAGAGAGFEAGKQVAPNSIAAPLLGSMAGAMSPALLGGALRATARPIESAQNALATGLNINPAKVKTFEEAGLQGTLADVSDSRFVKGAQNLLVETPFSSGVITKSIEKTNNDIANFLAPGLTQESAGTLAQSGLRDYQKRGQALAAQLQQKMSTHMVPDEAIPVPNMLNTINSQVKFTTPEAQAQFAGSALGKEYEKLAGIAARNEGAIPYQDLVYFRQNIDDQINNFGLMGFNKEQGAFKNLRAQIQNDVGNAFKAKGPEAIQDLERFNKFYSGFAKKNEEIVNGLIKDKSATETFKSIVTDLRVDGKKADTVLSTLNPEQKTVFSQSLVRELGMNPQNEFTPAYLATNFKKLEPKAQEVLLAPFTPEVQKQFKATMDAIDAMKNTKAIANPSGTFNQGLRFGTGVGVVTNPVTTGGLLLGGYSTAKLMTDPKFISWLAKAPKLTNPEQVSSHIGTLAKIAKTSPQIAPDIQQYLQSLESPSQSSTSRRGTTPKSLDSKELENLSDEQLDKMIEQERMSQSRNISPEQLNKMSDEEFSAFLQKQIIKQTKQPVSQNQSTVSPQLLNKIAQIESGGNPLAHAQTGSASGLYQFTNGTWKTVVDKYGAQTGITYRDKNNPKAQRIMADLMLKDNEQVLKGFLGRDAKPTEIYLTHFLGLGGAKQLLSAHPQQLAFRVLPEAARANRAIFFKNGRPLTTKELYYALNNKVMQA